MNKSNSHTLKKWEPSKQSMNFLIFSYENVPNSQIHALSSIITMTGSYAYKEKGRRREMVPSTKKIINHDQCAMKSNIEVPMFKILEHTTDFPQRSLVMSAPSVSSSNRLTDSPFLTMSVLWWDMSDFPHTLAFGREKRVWIYMIQK